MSQQQPIETYLDIRSLKLSDVSLRGVVVDLSGLRDRGPGFKTRSRPLTFTKADTTRCGVLIALTNSSEFRHAKDVKTLELRVMNLTKLDRLISQVGIKWTLNEF
jgi:hypothetical protein